MWQGMTTQQKINCALSEDEPQTAEMAYCRGLGFKLLGPEYYSDATNAFERSAVLDKSFASPSQRQIALIYSELGDNLTAFNCMKKAFNNLWELCPKDFEITKKIEIDYSVSLSGKEISYSDARQAKEELSDKLLGKDPNVVSIATVEEVNASGHKTGNYVVEVGVISSLKHGIQDEYVLPNNNQKVRICVKQTGVIVAQDDITMQKARADIENILQQAEKNIKKYGPY